MKDRKKRAVKEEEIGAGNETKHSLNLIDIFDRIHQHATFLFFVRSFVGINFSFRYPKANTFQLEQGENIDILCLVLTECKMKRV